MLILAQHYRHTLFLDYSDGAEQGNEPRVGCVDFDDFSNWQPHCVWWESFDAFFAALRRYETLY